MNKTKLKPCPHCGGKAELYDDSKKRSEYGEYRVICQEDGCINSAVRVTYFEEHHAINAWNKRVKQ